MAAPSVYPKAVSQAGGDCVTVTWAWPGGGPFVATLAQGGRAFPLTSGLAAGPDSGFFPRGQPWRLFLPPLPSRDDATVTLARASAPLVPLASFALRVVADFYWPQSFEFRSLLPSVWATGPRSIAALPAPQEATP